MASSAELVEPLAAAVEPRAIADRRDLHRHPETGWTEFRTSAVLVERLRELGWAVRWGRELYDGAERLGLPPEGALDAAYERARAEGADARVLEPMQGGWTGCVADLEGAAPGPRVALRFDIDALPVPEADGPEHRPAREGFASSHPGLMHACGHDAHTAMGLGVAEVLSRTRDAWKGTVRLVFQPGEEGTRGAAAMVAAGLLDGFGAFLCPHVGAQSQRSGEIVAGISGFLATCKLDLRFTGREAHAGLAPEDGRNALLAAAAAVVQLHALPRHSGGNSRVNVGVLRAGTARNVVPGFAECQLELRGETTEVVAELERRARLIAEATAAAHEVEIEVTLAGAAPSARSDEAVMAAVERVASAVHGVEHVASARRAGASDDATAMMRRVQEQGGVAAYVIVGSALADGHHTPHFDIDESVLRIGIATLAGAALELLGTPATETV